MKAMKVLTWLTAGIICFAMGSAVWPPLGVFFLAAAGRAPDCSTHGAALAVQRFRLYDDVERRLSQSSRIRTRDGAYALVETPRGCYWEPVTAHGSEVVAQIAEIESKYAANAPDPVHKNDVVLDCGANIGVFTREALKRGASLVVAIEPVPQNLECLRRNLRAEISSGQVIVYPKGVWDKDDSMTLYESDNVSAEDSFVRRGNTHPGPELPLTTIDKLVRELKLDRVDFIKMDIEGAEARALAGAQQTLRRFRPRLEIEVSGNAQEIRGIAGRAWPGYRSECLVCGLDRAHMKFNPTMINLYP